MAGDRTNILIEGPAVPLAPRGALALGMAIHELATNAAKYGALSVPEGDVLVTWSVERTGDEEHLALEWVERGGPPVTTPEKQGFGTVLIKRGLAHDMSGSASIDFAASGVRASIRAPVGKIALDHSSRAGPLST